jgi:cytochrome P450
VSTTDIDPDHLLATLFLTEEGVADPAPIYHRLRETAPVHLSGTGAVFLSRFEDCDAVLRDNRFGKAEGASFGLVPEGDDEAAAYRRAQRERIIAERRVVAMLFLDPPHHTRQRRLVARAFTPKRVDALRASIRSLAERAVDALVAEGGGDLLELVGFPLPVAVIGTMVGVPEQDWPRFRSLIATAAAGIEPGATLAELQVASEAEQEVRSYFADLVEERRRAPGDDLLSAMIAVEEAGDSLTTGEVVAVATLLFAAGFETTTNLIGNGAAALLTHPDQLERVRADRSLVPRAVEEVLRWDSPVQVDVRRALEPAAVAGVPVDRGQAVVTLLGAATRDPARFSAPDELDVGREEGGPLSFAAGIHHCLGANLARAEGQEVLTALLERCPSLTLAGDLRRRQRMTLRGYQAVPVAVG